ncbi:MAG: hypothetical protein ACXVEW_10880, partial [Solirubrobacteraceae bacterium]
ISGTTGVGSDHATVLGSVTTAGVASQAWLDYGTTTAYGQRTAASAVSATASQQPASFSITGLLPSTTYHARITIVNQAGTVSTNDLSFTTASAQTGGGGGGTNPPASVRQTGTRALGTTSGATFTIPLPVSVGCPNRETCKVTATITVPEAEAASQRKRATKPVVISTAQISLRGGQRMKLKVKLNRIGAKLLRRRHELTTSFAVKVLAGRSATTRKSGKLVIKIRTPARKRH